MSPTMTGWGPFHRRSLQRFTWDQLGDVFLTACSLVLLVVAASMDWCEDVSWNGSNSSFNLVSWLHNSTTLINNKWLPLWSCGQNSWLQIQTTGFDSQRYYIFWVVGLERGPLSLVSKIEELLGWKISGSGLESRKYGSRDPSHWESDTLY
jgi:hypothetical protein